MIHRATTPWAPAAALAAAAAVAVAAWSGPLGGAANRAAPVAAAAAVLAARRASWRLAAAALAILLVAAPLIAGVAPAELSPGAWPALPARVSAGLESLASPGAAPADRWTVATALLLAGGAWIVAAALTARPSRARASAAVVVACAPWAAASMLAPATTAPWHGAVLAFGGGLWWSFTRLTAGRAVLVSVALAAASGMAAHGAGPRQPWWQAPWIARVVRPPFATLDAVPTFGPLRDRRTGAPMLEITANEPAFWRMHMLDVFDGAGWAIDAMPPRPQPQPAARRAWVDVRVRGLRNDFVVAPGRIDAVQGDAGAKRAVGEAWRLQDSPRDGTRYRVRAEVVPVDPVALQRAPNPSGAALRRYTLLGYPGVLHSHIPESVAAFLGISGNTRVLGAGLSLEMPLFGEQADRQGLLAGTPYRRVAALAQRLAAGARTEWEVVARVVSYLRDDTRFRYTTQVPEPGRYPLIDFLLRTHAGYCQHFAGAAALLLRIAGVPARVVGGFATGVRANGRYRVRDVDAHDWIEVYFPGYGWVPFNPTPADAAAAIPRRLDLLAPPAGDRGRARSALVAALALMLAAGWSVRRRMRRRPPRLGDLLVGVARGTGARVSAASTLGELRTELERTVGPRTAALAAEAERARFAPDPPVPPRRPGLRLAIALLADAGPWRAARIYARRRAATDA